MNRSVRCLLSGIVLLGAFAGSARASLWGLAASLTGVQEVPPNASPATGTFAATYDTLTNVLSYQLTVNGLLAGVTASHVHAAAPPGVNAAVVIPLLVPGGQTSFNVIGTASPNSPANEATFEGTLANGPINSYVNVHSTLFPGGEIRGQLIATLVPEPATMLVFGPAVLLFMRRRRR